MKKILFIKANPKSSRESFGMQIADVFFEAYNQINDQYKLITLDLYKEDIPFVDPSLSMAWIKYLKNEPLTTDEEQKVKRVNGLIDQFKSVDQYVFVSPLWNLGCPPLLKAYIDIICFASQTFTFENEQVGYADLLKNKKALHIQSRGGIYIGEDAVNFEFCDRYLKAILNYIGLEDYHHVIIEGVLEKPDQVDQILAKGKDRAKAVAKIFATE